MVVHCGLDLHVSMTNDAEHLFMCYWPFVYLGRNICSDPLPFLKYLVRSHCVACSILVPQQGIEPRPSAVKARSPNHWTTREFPPLPFLNWDICFLTLSSKSSFLF